MVFNIDNYKGHFAMHCATAREAKEFCDYLHSVGKRWNCGVSYDDVTHWDAYKDETCYCFNDGFLDTLSCCWHKGYTILEWSDFTRKFTKADLKNGMIVETANEYRYLVLEDNFINENGFMVISDYNDDLTINSEPYKWNINKIYKSLAYNTNCIFKDDYLTLIWVRKEKPKPIEMTLEEVCEALGREIKIIK